MDVPTKPRFVAVFMMMVAVCLSLGLPAADVLDAVYDESESVPYEVTPLLSSAVRTVAVPTTQAPLRALHLEDGVPSPFSPPRVRGTDAHRSANARTSLALLCTLLC